MAVMKFKRFSKPQVLRRIETGLLAEFLQRFQEALAARGVVLPPAGPADERWHRALAGLFLSPEGLPDELNEALFAVDELATPSGQERLEAALAEAGLELNAPPDCTREEFTLRVWLAAPELLARAHNRQRMLRLTAFEHFGTRLDPEDRASFVQPAPEAVARTAEALDEWFSRHRRGERTTRIETYAIDGESWFLVRHGENYTRAPKVERERTEIIHFRPERDDVVVYSPEADEIRINTRTKGERDLYREEFGRLLRGDREYFSDQETYTLEPLREAGAEALATAGLRGIRRIVLREIEVAADNGFHEVTTKGADDLFRSAATRDEMEDPIPPVGTLARATFDVQFEDSAKVRPVQIRLPNVLKVGRHCDLRALNFWLNATGIRKRRTAAPRGIRTLAC